MKPLDDPTLALIARFVDEDVDMNHQLTEIKNELKNLPNSNRSSSHWPGSGKTRNATGGTGRKEVSPKRRWPSVVRITR
jgi:hypothetical protein